MEHNDMSAIDGRVLTEEEKAEARRTLAAMSNSMEPTASEKVEDEKANVKSVQEQLEDVVWAVYLNEDIDNLDMAYTLSELATTFIGLQLEQEDED